MTEGSSTPPTMPATGESEFRLQLLQVVSSINAGFAGEEAGGLDAALRETLAWLGAEVGVDRAYVFRLDEDGRHWEAAAAWCAPGIAPVVGPGGRVPVADLPWAFARLERASLIYLAHLDGLPAEAWRERARWQGQGLQSALVVALRDGQRLIGTLGLATQRAPKEWEGDDIALLRALASIIEQAWRRQRAEAALREATLAAEAASRLKSEFLAMISHEVRTPLNGVLGMAQLLSETRMDEEQADFVATIQASGSTLLAIFDTILDLSTIEAGTLELSLERCDPAAIVEEIVADFAGRAQQLGSRLTQAVHGDTPRGITSDPVRIRQILANLLDNALKFAPGSDVRLTLRPLADSEGQRWLRFAVTDRGPGVPPEAAGMIFERFTQADGSSTRRAGGLGIGLSICDNLVKLFGGQIGLEPVPEGGACFWFTIPVALAAGAREGSTAPEACAIL